MFTGLIREIAPVTLNGDRLEIISPLAPEIGSSVAVNGACLTVTETSASAFAARISHETRSSIAVENLRGKAHIEPAMRLGGAIDGHITQGHIDFIGAIERVTARGDNRDLIISAPAAAMRLISPKGSIAIDGVSLTIGEVFSGAFGLILIDHTLKNTLFGDYRVSRRVNIETDLFARYAARILERDRRDQDGGLTRFASLF